MRWYIESTVPVTYFSNGWWWRPVLRLRICHRWVSNERCGPSVHTGEIHHAPFYIVWPIGNHVQPHLRWTLLHALLLLTTSGGLRSLSYPCFPFYNAIITGCVPHIFNLQLRALQRTLSYNESFKELLGKETKQCPLEFSPTTMHEGQCLGTKMPCHCCTLLKHFFHCWYK